jgi:hypothetical protein
MALLDIFARCVQPSRGNICPCGRHWEDERPEMAAESSLVEYTLQEMVAGQTA